MHALDKFLISSQILVYSKVQQLRKQQNELGSLAKIFALFKSEEVNDTDDQLTKISKAQSDIKVLQHSMANIEYCQTEMRVMTSILIVQR